MRVLRNSRGRPSAAVSNPVVEKALESLTLVIRWRIDGAVIGDTWDREMADYHFQILCDGRERYEPGEIAAWAASHGWSDASARELGDIAEAARDRRRRRRAVRDPVLAQWRAHAAEPGIGDDRLG